MARRINNIQQNHCWDCIFAKPFDVSWNRTPEGVPITKHCHKDPSDIKKGIMKNTIACSLFVKS